MGQQQDGSQLRRSDQFHDGTPNGRAQHLPANAVEEEVYVGKGTSQAMIDFFLGPEQMRSETRGGKDRKAPWNMHSDHRVIQMTLAGDQHRTSQDGHHPGKGR